MITIIDYGAGNLKSVEHALRFIGAEAEITSDVSKIEDARALILPGVGNFGDAMRSLGKLRSTIVDKINGSAPFLGICLGMQMLFDGSEEAPDKRGLSIFRGGCSKFPNGRLKVPQIGWNSVRITSSGRLLLGVENNSYFYFVHSYYAEPKDVSIVNGICEYGVSFPAIVSRDNVFACQFHPEKSGTSGLRVLKNFAKLVG